MRITAPFYVDYGENIHFGDGCEVNMNCTFSDDNIMEIGGCLIAPNVQIYTAFYPAKAAQRQGEKKEDGSFEFCTAISAPVKIGKNVWMGTGAVILPGVTIGDDTVIGAGSVVTGDISAGKAARGNPCRIIRDNLQCKIKNALLFAGRLFCPFRRLYSALI